MSFAHRVDDQVDCYCKLWAVQRRKALGIILPKMMVAHERLGVARCTLAQVHDEGEGASQGTISQHFPEVYLGDALKLHRCRAAMPGPWREVMHTHYVWWEIPIRTKIAWLETNQRRYFENLDALKIYVAQCFDLDADTAVKQFYPTPARVSPCIRR